ncbi:hypothetical protein K491DRAFT_721430 [Lophiostoma macrostomum CBS 122681]|uniref:Uncharacterized protein n=1 Tax=Lophiostoma macrostomum CBS 122681 TaxID=1314788 RepID=A0A6A6STC0_9PLEO|nr:hypothetical protein K491DRAFT_721430 [Lophiostoma macrostomum CBS 122681]
MPPATTIITVTRTTLVTALGGSDPTLHPRQQSWDNGQWTGWSEPAWTPPAASSWVAASSWTPQATQSPQTSWTVTHAPTATITPAPISGLKNGWSVVVFVLVSMIAFGLFGCGMLCWCKRKRNKENKGGGFFSFLKRRSKPSRPSRSLPKEVQDVEAQMGSRSPPSQTHDYPQRPPSALHPDTPRTLIRHSRIRHPLLATSHVALASTRLTIGANPYPGTR